MCCPATWYWFDFNIMAIDTQYRDVIPWPVLSQATQENAKEARLFVFTLVNKSAVAYRHFNHHSKYIYFQTTYICNHYTDICLFSFTKCYYMIRFQSAYFNLKIILIKRKMRNTHKPINEAQVICLNKRIINIRWSPTMKTGTY